MDRIALRRTARPRAEDRPELNNVHEVSVIREEAGDPGRGTLIRVRPPHANAPKSASRASVGQESVASPLFADRLGLAGPRSLNSAHLKGVVHQSVRWQHARRPSHSAGPRRRPPAARRHAARRHAARPPRRPPATPPARHAARRDPHSLTRPGPYENSPAMRVLFLTSWYPTSELPYGGVFVREHARAVQAALGEVAVLHIPDGASSGSGPWRLERETDTAITAGFRTARLTSRAIRIPGSRRLSYWATYGLHLLAVAVAIRGLRRDGFKPDLIHAHVFNAGAVGVVMGRLFGLPVVVTEHSTLFPRRELDRGMLKRARYAFSHAARVLPVSSSLKEAIEAYGIQAKFDVIPNAVDVDLFHPGAEPKSKPKPKIRKLMFVGRLEPTEHKGFPTLVAALEILKERRSDWRLDVVGDGPSREDCAGRIAGRRSRGGGHVPRQSAQARGGFDDASLGRVRDAEPVRDPGRRPARSHGIGPADRLDYRRCDPGGRLVARRHPRRARRRAGLRRRAGSSALGRGLRPDGHSRARPRQRTAWRPSGRA